MTYSAPSIAEAYKHRGLLFQALAKLAAQGFPAQPVDAADIVHDFFLEGLTDVLRTFNPQRAAFTTYMYASFVQFARSRIVRLQRQRGVLLPPADLMRLMDRSKVAQGPEEDLDSQRARFVIDRLSRPHRELLEKWLTSNHVSERELARSLGWSRYKLRQQLVEALGRASLELTATTRIGDIDTRVAEAIWRDGLTVDEAAARLQLTSQRVRNSHARFQQYIAQALSPLSAGKQARARSDEMSNEVMQRLLHQIAHDPDLDAVIRQVASHAAELVTYLEEAGDAVEADWRALPAERLARIYDTLGRELGGADDGDDLLSEEDNRALFEAYANDRRAVGTAFDGALVPSLPNGIVPLLDACRGRHRVGPEERARLREEPDVVAGGDHAESLTEFGLTPAHLVLASDAIAMLVERVLHNRGARGEVSPILRCREGSVARLDFHAWSESVSRDDMVKEICAVAVLDASLAGVVLDWMAESSPFLRSLFAGFSASEEGNVIRLEPLADWDENLFWRWGPRFFDTSRSGIDKLDASALARLRGR
jgi:hypothetical protein